MSTPPAGQEEPKKRDNDINDSNKPKTIAHPRRLLILTPSTSSTTTVDPLKTVPTLLHALTGESVNLDNLPHHHPPQQPHTTDAGNNSSNSNNNNNQTPKGDYSIVEQRQGKSLAGYTTHAPLHIETRYYIADVPIWVDEIIIPPSEETETETESETVKGKGQEKGQWKTEFLSDEAQVVRDAIGAVLICVHNPVAPSVHKAIPIPEGQNPSGTARRSDEHAEIIKNTVRVVSEVKQKMEEERDGGMGEVPGLLVLLGEDKTINHKSSGGGDNDDDDDGGALDVEPFSAAWWEDMLFEMDILGFEVVLWDPARSEGPTARNEYGELQGLSRVKEVLSAVEWRLPAEDNEDDDYDADALFTDGLDVEIGQLEREMMGLRFAINNNSNDYNDDAHDDDNIGDPEMQVDDLEALMQRMRSIKDMSAELPEAQRKAFTAKAVRDIMREL